MTGITRAAHPVAVVCLVLVVSGCAGGPSAGESSPAPSPSPSSTATPFRDTGAAILDPGTYILDFFPVGVTFDIPEADGPGWHVGKSNPYAAIVLWYDPPEISYGFAFWNVDNLYVDPCDVFSGRLEPPVGPSVDDLVTALSTQPGFDATAPVDITIGQFRGRRMELTALDSIGCAAARPWSAGAENTDMEPGEARRLDILDVDGVRVVLVIIEPEQPDPVVQPQLYRILDSMRTDATP